VEQEEKEKEEEVEENDEPQTPMYAACRSGSMGVSTPVELSNSVLPAYSLPVLSLFTASPLAPRTFFSLLIDPRFLAPDAHCR
jgi:hypothetical protein